MAITLGPNGFSSDSNTIKTQVSNTTVVENHTVAGGSTNATQRLPMKNTLLLGVRIQIVVMHRVKFGVIIPRVVIIHLIVLVVVLIQVLVDLQHQLKVHMY